MEIIVRADFYPNGMIIPLSITDEDGKSSNIKKIVSTEKTIGSKGLLKYQFVCEADSEILVLSFQNNIWNGMWR